MRFAITFTTLAFVITLAACARPSPATGPAEPAPAAFETERVHSEAQVRVWVPQDWRVDDRKPGTLVLTDPAEEIGVLFVAVDSEDLLGALGRIAQEIADQVESIELVGQPEEADINGMSALFQDGKGVLDGAPIELSVGAVSTPANKYLLVVGMADAATLHRHEQTVLDIMQRLKPYQP